MRDEKWCSGILLVTNTEVFVSYHARSKLHTFQKENKCQNLPNNLGLKSLKVTSCGLDFLGLFSRSATLLSELGLYLNFVSIIVGAWNSYQALKDMYIILVRFLLCLKYSALVSVVALFGTSWVMTYSICSGSASCLRGLALPLAASPPPRPPLVRTPEAGLLLVAAPLVRWLEDQMKVRRRICLHSSSHISMAWVSYGD